MELILLVKVVVLNFKYQENKRLMGYKSSGSKEFDNYLKKLRQNYLQYYPFIGVNYKTAKEQILVVGESHYADNNKESEEIHKDEYLTRAVVNSKGIARSYGETKTFTNFHKAMVSNDKFDSKKFWDLLAFYNFVQRPMFSSKHRPKTKDFREGWKTFYKVIDVVKPTVIIFIGVKASEFLSNSLKTSDYSLENYKWHNKISGTYPREGDLISNDGNSTQLIFIQHSGHHFSHQKWNKYLKEKLGTKLDWLIQSV